MPDCLPTLPQLRAYLSRIAAVHEEAQAASRPQDPATAPPRVMPAAKTGSVPSVTARMPGTVPLAPSFGSKKALAQAVRGKAKPGGGPAGGGQKRAGGTASAKPPRAPAAKKSKADTAATAAGCNTVAAVTAAGCNIGAAVSDGSSAAGNASAVAAAAAAADKPAKAPAKPKAEVDLAALTAKIEAAAAAGGLPAKLTLPEMKARAGAEG